ncbi:MAG: thiamine-monophosphate kinase, partial [Polaribacter sp.]
MLEDKNTQKTSLADLGEFGLINHITKYFKIENASTVKGIGDDAAVLGASEKQTLVTTDLLIEGVH